MFALLLLTGEAPSPKIALFNLNSPKMDLIDQHERVSALNPHESFIVQAPAGSGKTEILTQRFLALLCEVDSPEQILAITFTKKAAREMKNRIMLALANANTGQAVSAHEQTTQTLAKAVLKHAHALNWQLLTNPQRLRLLTIDALCASITKQMPMLSQGIPGAQVQEDCFEIYLEAALETIHTSLQDTALKPSMLHLLRHLGNQQQRLIDLFANMLSQRDQWLPYIFHCKQEFIRNYLETSLAFVQEELVDEINELLDARDKETLQSLMQYAHKQLLSAGKDGLSYSDSAPNQTLDFTNHSLAFWKMVAQTVLTSQHQWRKKITKSQGFPSPSSCKTAVDKNQAKEYKNEMESLLIKLSQDDAFAQCLISIKLCPARHYTDIQWQTLEALITLLPVLAGQLNLIFQEKNCVDFIEIATQANQAMGHLREPSELALYFDHNIKHCLIDEFQDTSFSQFQLLEKITQDWSGHDGRTLFVVGDPMQSIYRFRQAEVALFTQVKNHGIGLLKPKFLALRCNFRSDKKIVHWVNETFCHIFPKQEDTHSGAIPYHFAEATREIYPDNALHFYHTMDAWQQAQCIIAQVKTIQANAPADTIAILARTRNELTALLKCLRETNMSYQGINIENLSGRPMIRDVWTLTQALLHPAYRLAWLSLLRTPWCGLKLEDLLRVAKHSMHIPIIKALKDSTLYQQISTDGKARIEHLLHSVDNALANRNLYPLSLWIHKAWDSLQGNYHPSAQEQKDIQQFWSLLDEIETKNKVYDFKYIEAKINQLYTSTHCESSLNIMTIHKSKGLEFDHVILPSVNQGSLKVDQTLLRWQQRQDSSGNEYLLLAPIKPNDESLDITYQFLGHLDKQKERHEFKRLLYVATTRAKKTLSFYAHGELDKASKGSFYKLLENKLPVAQEYSNDNEYQTRQNTLKRLPRSHLSSYKGASSLEFNKPYPLPSPNPYPKILGIFIHELIQSICEKEIENIHQMKSHLWSHRLKSLGLPDSQIPEALELCKLTIQNLFEDKTGRWICAPHAEARNEWALSTFVEGKTRQWIIDRTFIDNNVRWVIDFKTQATAIQNQGEFITQALEKYQNQLNNYATIISQFESREIHCALYYPLLKLFIPWQYVREARQQHGDTLNA